MNRRVLLLLAWFKNHNDPVGADYAGITISTLLNITGDFTAGLDQALEILSRFEKRNDEYGQMLAYMAIGIAFDRSKNYENAIDFTRKGMAIAKNIDDKGSVAEALD